MSRKYLDDAEFTAFQIIRKNIFDDFQYSLDIIRNEYPALWNKRISRIRIINSLQIYLRDYFLTKNHHMTNEQTKENKLKNKGYF